MTLAVHPIPNDGPGLARAALGISREKAADQALVKLLSISAWEFKGVQGRTGTLLNQYYHSRLQRIREWLDLFDRRVTTLTYSANKADKAGKDWSYRVINPIVPFIAIQNRELEGDPLEIFPVMFKHEQDYRDYRANGDDGHVFEDDYMIYRTFMEHLVLQKFPINVLRWDQGRFEKWREKWGNDYPQQELPYWWLYSSALHLAPAKHQLLGTDSI